MKTNNLFTAILALLLPLASLCKEHRLVADASNLRKKTEVISDKIKESSPFIEFFKAKLLTEDKVEVLSGILSSLCEDDEEDSTHDLISADIDAEMESVASYFCSFEASGFVVNAATTALTELTSSGDMMAMTSSFIKEDEALARPLLKLGMRKYKLVNGVWVKIVRGITARP